MNGQEEIFEEIKRGQKRGQTNSAFDGHRLPKTHQDYWRKRLKQRAFKGRDGATVPIPEWQVRMKYKLKEAWFNLGTANQSAAAVKARDIYLSLASVGWEATLERYKPSAAVKPEVCTVGEFLKDVAERSHLKPITVRRYAVKLRKMVYDVAKLGVGLKGKAKLSKFDYVNGGRARWLAAIDSQPLDVLTPETVVAWRNQYVADAGNDPVARKSAERSAASYIRCARSLFTNDILPILRVKVPPHPFKGVKLKDPGAQRYRSEINPEWLLACADRELREQHPQQYLALFLCLWAGLRRKEADMLTWAQVNFEQGCIHVRRTQYFEPKTEESQRDVDLATAPLDVIRSFKNGSTSEFVLVGAEPNIGATYDCYRCDGTWRDLHTWLREKGVTQKKAIHSLRKESGSLIASSYGIEAARQHLGHRDIRTTSSHYVDKKKRIEVHLPLGSWPSNASVVSGVT